MIVPIFYLMLFYANNRKCRRFRSSRNWKCHRCDTDRGKTCDHGLDDCSRICRYFTRQILTMYIYIWYEKTYMSKVFFSATLQYVLFIQTWNNKCARKWPYDDMPSPCLRVKSWSDRCMIYVYYVLILFFNIRLLIIIRKNLFHNFFFFFFFAIINIYIFIYK